MPIRAALLVLAVAFVVAPVAAHAQGTPGPALPVGMDMRKAKVGAWSEYKLSLAELPSFQQRFALVARDASTNQVEMISEGGPMGPGGKVTIRVTLAADLAKADRVRALAMQLGDNSPMDLHKEQSAQKDQFAPVDPRKLVGSQKITVPAGTFATKHFRGKDGNGRTYDVWVSDEAPPFGIVKLVGNVSQGDATPQSVTMELAARGQDAKPTITAAPQPFDEAVLIGQMNRSLGKAPPSGAKSKER